MPRLVKTQTEMEGRYEDVWVYVDEDELEPWPAERAFDALGQAVTRVDGPLRVSGSARYTVDVALPGMLHAAVLRSPLAHARVRSLDLEAARRAPGVRAVVGPDDRIGEGDAVLFSEPEYVGQAIAAVAADTFEEAEAALGVLAADLEPLAFVVDPDAALEGLRFTRDPQEEGRLRPPTCGSS